MNRKLYSKVRIVDINNIFPFEWNSLENLTEYNPEDFKVIHHPLLTIEIDDNNFMLLDNSDIYYQYLKSGIKHLPIQINNENELELSTYSIGFNDISIKDLIKLSEKYPQQIILNDKPKADCGEFLKLDFTFDIQNPITIWIRNSTRAGCPYPLELIFKMVLKKSEYYPVIERRRRSDALTKSRSYDSVISLPSFCINDLKSAVKSDRLFPALIFNIVPKSRVFNIDFPMSVLLAEISLSEKEAFLKELIALRIQRKKAVYYTGQVYLLNQ